MNAAKTGYVAEFVTGYLQREIRLEATVAGGTDAGLRDASKTGYAPGRLVHYENGAITAPVGANLANRNFGNANYIIAQSDDTIRDVPEDYNYTEKYSTLPNLICKNSAEKKTVAVYKIVNFDDIKLKNLG